MISWARKKVTQYNTLLSTDIVSVETEKSKARVWLDKT